MAGTVPTKGIAKRARRAGSTSVEAVLQAITTRSGWKRAMRRSITASTRATSCVFAEAAIGKAGIVGCIDDMGARAGRASSATIR
jgi:hypothetical protein